MSQQCRVLLHRALIAAGLGLVVLLPLSPLGAQLIETVDYSDTFTVAEQGGVPERTDGSSNTGRPAYDVEDPHGNPVSTWTPQDQFSFNTGLGSACCGYKTNDGNDGAATGLAQSGGSDFSFAYGLRSSYVVQLDAILPLDRLDVSSLPAPGNSIFTANSLSVFFRDDAFAGTPHAAFPQTGIPGIGLYNGSVETALTDAEGKLIKTGVNDDIWHNFAVHFDQDTGILKLYVDLSPVAVVDLNTFAGGAYRKFSNGAVGTGGAGYDLATHVLWVDNFQVGEPGRITGACFVATPSVGTAPLTVSFDAACSVFENAPQGYSWDFGDGTTGTGATVQHIYSVGGSYQVELTVRDTGGKTATTTRTITVYEITDSFSDDFNRADGLIDGWTVFSVPDTWSISGGKLTTGPTGEERWIWAGDPPVILPARVTISFEMTFLSGGTYPEVGRHAGAVFCASVPKHRSDRDFSGYFVDWIDRAGDRGVRLTRVDKGVFAPPYQDVGSPADVPLVWRVEITGSDIKVYGDDVLYLSANDTTYRGGFAGLWTWSNGQEVAFDNYSASVPANPLSACFTVTSPGAPFSGDTVAFDAACTENVGAGTITSYAWNFGDAKTGSGAQVSHAYAAPGAYTVELTVRDSLGNEAKTQKTVTVYQKTLSFSDDFNRADGPIDGWTVFSVPDTWNISGGRLTTGPTGEERWIWAGSPPYVMPKTCSFYYDYAFLSAGTDATVGRHGGIAFCANKPTHRYDAGWSGYFVDWIDRTAPPYADRGPRLSRVDNGAFTEIFRGQSSDPGVPTEPPLSWEVVLDGEDIIVSGDGVEYFDIVDMTYRGGFFGFWAWAGGQEITIDNVEAAGQPLTAYFKVSPPTPVTGYTATFDGSVSESFAGTVTSYAWDLGDGTTAATVAVEHVYEAAGVYVVKLTVQDGVHSPSTLERTVTVLEGLAPFADCFDRAQGPVDGWTPVVGMWDITADGQVETVTTTGEAFLYAGDPPLWLGPKFVAEVDWTFLGWNPANLVGRHAAVSFYWNTATDNRFAGNARGYSVFYIDRAGDRGLTLVRFSFGGLTVLNPPGGTPTITEPPQTLRIEVDGPSIKVLADGVLAIEAQDSTYRDGLFALWTWNENDVQFDNVLLGKDALPSCGGPEVETNCGDGIDNDGDTKADCQDSDCASAPNCQRPQFRRGDADGKGGVPNITDGIYVLNYLFLGGLAPPCQEAADADNKGGVNITDGIYILNYLFQGGPAPPSPGPDSCGPDPDEPGTAGDLGCETPTAGCEP